MPTPFPGMDPYWERCADWRAIHLQLIAELVRYDLLHYDLVIDYPKEAQPSLKGEAAVWADGLLREHGLR